MSAKSGALDRAWTGTGETGNMAGFWVSVGENMRYLMLPVLVFALVFGSWPYVDLLRLDRALTQHDYATLSGLLDLDAIRAERKRVMALQIVDTHNPVTHALHQLATVLPGNDTEAEDAVTLDWVRKTLRPVPERPNEDYPSILQYTTFAFFEDFRHFIVRIHDLGEHPIHIRWTLRDWVWRVTAIYD